MTRRVDKVDEERRLVDLHVVGLGDTIGGLGGVGGSFSGDLGVLGGLAGALGGLGLELLASDLITASKNHRHTHIDQPKTARQRQLTKRVHVAGAKGLI